MDRVVDGACFINWWYAWIVYLWLYMYAVQDQVNEAPSLWCSPCRIYRWELHAALWLHISTLMLLLAAAVAVPQDFYFLVSICVERSWWLRIRWCWTGLFQEKGQCLFIGKAALSLFVSSCFPSLLSFYGLVLWGWGLRTDRVLIALSQPSVANLFLIIIIIIRQHSPKVARIKLNWMGAKFFSVFSTNLSIAVYIL